MYYWGVDYPYWYNIGQLQQESNCRESITAFDGGKGLSQFMPKTEVFVEEMLGEQLNMYNSKHAIKAQTFYLRYLQKQNWSGRLWITFQAYNGGYTLLKKERDRAGVTDWGAMYAVCKRKQLKFNWGILDMCEVNYDYSQKVYKYGKKYKTGEDRMRFW